jgi:hypothetical protein
MHLGKQIFTLSRPAFPTINYAYPKYGRKAKIISKILTDKGAIRLDLSSKR